MSNPNPRDLTKYDVLALLEETDQELPPGEPINVTIGGGSAVVFWWDHRSTTDVDVISSPKLPEELATAAQKVAARHNLPSDWLNADAGEVIMPSLPIVSKRVFKGKNRLTAFIPNHRYILAMKLLAGRNRDLNDAIQLMRETGLKTKEDLYDLIKESYPRSLFPGIDFDFVDQVADLAQKDS